MNAIWFLLCFSSWCFLVGAQVPPREDNCDPEWFGRPDNQDCKDALARLPDWGLTVSEDEDWQVIREFVNIGREPRIPASDNHENNVRTPLVYTNGTCTVAVIIPDDYFTEGSMLVDTSKFNAKADSLRIKCVEGQGSGGFYHGVPQWRGIDIENFPELYICGVDSQAERYLDYLYNCITDADGNPLCQNEQYAEEREPDWMQFLNDVQLPRPEDPVPKGAKQACSGSCLDLEDCKIGSDCLCASTKGMLLSSTWGRHSCMYVAGTAIALAAAAIKPSSPCRGRCLLEKNGTVQIDWPANQTNATNNIDIPLVNLTEVPNTADYSVAATNGSLSPDKENLYPSGIPYGLRLAQPASQTAPILTCPCNCTYVSAACCLSRIVWEEPSKQIRMEPLPANASVFCDAGTGKWESKSTASSASTEDKSGFIGLGSVKWNSSAADRARIPKI